MPQKCNPFLQSLTGRILKLVFVVNLYEPCVSNKTVNGKHFTIIWYLENLNFSNEDPEEVTKC